MGRASLRRRENIAEFPEIDVAAGDDRNDGARTARPVSAAASGRAPAPSAITRARSAAIRNARRVSSRVTTIDPSTTARTRSHMRGKTLMPPAPSTNEGRHSVKTCADCIANDRARGAAVSGSAPHTLTSGFKAFTALATPVTKPPPPTAAITALTSGTSSSISSPIVACPVMKSSSSNGWMKVPSTPAYARSSSAFQATSYGTGTRVAPSAFIRSIFAAGRSQWPRRCRARPPCAQRTRLPARHCRTDRPDATPASAVRATPLRSPRHAACSNWSAVDTRVSVVHPDSLAEVQTKLRRARHGGCNPRAPFLIFRVVWGETVDAYSRVVIAPAPIAPAAAPRGSA